VSRALSTATLAATLTALAASHTGCGTTGGNLVSFDVVAQGVMGGSVTDTGLGWHVELSEATLYIGAVYLNIVKPISGMQATPCILPTTYSAQELYPLDVNVLSTSPQPFPQPATGTDDEAQTGELWLTGGDVNADADSTVIAHVVGTATSATQTIPFSATITIGSTNRGARGGGNPALPSIHPICSERIVSPIPIDLSPHDQGTLVITVDPRAWFKNVDFTMVPPDGEFPDDNTNNASQNLLTGIQAATATYQFTFE
jgi:hypothetical protein